MLRFKQFLMEGIVNWYHRADPATAERLQKGEKIRPQGLSIFLNPEEAAKYNFETSAGHIPPDAKTVTGIVSTRRIIPDIEWHPDSYKPIFKDIAKQIQTNPDFRVPSLTRTAITRTGTKQYVTPGISSETDPNTGKKAIVRNWEPRFALKYPEGHPHAGYLGEPHALESFPIKDPVSGELIDIDDPRVKPMIDSKSRITPDGKAGPETRAWGGSATTHGRYPEQRDLDVLTKKSDITKITNDAIEQGKRGFRTQGGSSVSVSGAPNPAMTSSLKGAEVAGKVATTLIDPTQPVIDATVAQAAKAAPKLGNVDLLPASRSRIPGAPRPVATTLGYAGAGVLGGIAGEYLVKPAAEKLGVFDAVEKGSRAAFSRMPDWAVDASDKALGAAQFALDPLSPIAAGAGAIMQKGMEEKTKREVDAMIKAGKPSQVRFTGSKL